MWNRPAALASGSEAGTVAGVGEEWHVQRAAAWRVISMLAIDYAEPVRFGMTVGKVVPEQGRVLPPPVVHDFLRWHQGSRRKWLRAPRRSALHS